MHSFALTPSIIMDAKNPRLKEAQSRAGYISREKPGFTRKLTLIYPAGVWPLVAWGNLRLPVDTPIPD
jgi:hypothetical protein